MNSPNTIAVLGAGLSGIAAARLAKADGADVVVLDSGPPAKLIEKGEQLMAEGIESVFGTAAETVVEDRLIDLVVQSPGIALDKPIVTQFTDRGIPVIGEIEFAFQHCKAEVVAITGTNGKTTTTEMISAVFEHVGKRSVNAGNYGNPFSEIVIDGNDYDVISLEVSSFQLEAIETFKPKAAVWINFAPDHLDRYEGPTGLDDYREAKLQIFKNQDEEDVAIVHAPDLSVINSKLETQNSKPGTVTTFHAFGDDANYTFDGTNICLAGQPVFDFTKTQLRGTHNAENIMATIAATSVFGITAEQVATSLSDYRAPAHRCELVGEFDGHEFINDSKATNLHALESSLRGQRENVILIAGGKDKGLEFGEISNIVGQSVSHALLIGEIGERIAEAWADSVTCSVVGTIEKAVEESVRLARPKETILFSPGTSSFDQFASYNERGDAFRRLVDAL